MTIWYIVILVLFIASLLEISGFTEISAMTNKDKILGRVITYDEVIFVYIATVLTLLSAFRFETGRDWINYIEMFQNARSFYNDSGIEKGYIGINILFKYFRLTYWQMQACILIFCSYVLFTSFHKRSSYPLYTLIIYFCLYYFSNDLAQTRQYIAMSILILGLKFIRERKILIWCLFILLAMQFHVTAVVALPLYFTCRIKVRPIYAYILLGACLFISLFGLDLVWWILDIAKKISFLPNRILNLLDMYMVNDLYNKPTTVRVALLKYVFYFIVVFLYNYRKSEINDADTFLLNFLIGVLCVSMGYSFSQFSRIGNYYMLCGGGIFAYNILPSSRTFFKNFEYIRLIISILWILLLVTSFIVNNMHLPEYTYKSLFLLVKVYK